MKPLKLLSRFVYLFAATLCAIALDLLGVHVSDFNGDE